MLLARKKVLVLVPINILDIEFKDIYNCIVSIFFVQYTYTTVYREIFAPILFSPRSPSLSASEFQTWREWRELI